MDKIREYVGLKYMHLIGGGIGIHDPEGRIKYCLGGRDSSGDGFYVLFGHEGEIVGMGGTFNGVRYRIPVSKFVDGYKIEEM